MTRGEEGRGPVARGSHHHAAARRTEAAAWGRRAAAVSRFALMLTMAGLLSACGSDGETASAPPAPVLTSPWDARLSHALTLLGAPYPNRAVPPSPPGPPTCLQIGNLGAPPPWPAEHQVYVRSFANLGSGNMAAVLSTSSTQWNTANCAALTPVVIGNVGTSVPQGILEINIGAHTAVNVHLTHATTPKPLPTIWDFFIGGGIDSTFYTGYEGNWRVPMQGFNDQVSFHWLATAPANANFEVRDTVDYLRTYGSCIACDFSNYIVQGIAVPSSGSLKNSNATGAVFQNMSFAAGVDFTGLNLTNATFQDVTLVSPNFQGFSLQGVTFGGATSISSPNFTGANLNGVVFTGSTTVTNPVFLSASLKNVTLSGTASMTAVDLRGAKVDHLTSSGGVSMTQVRVGKDASGNCTQLSNSVLTRINLQVSQVDSTCTSVSAGSPSTPLFPATALQPKSVALSNWPSVDWSNAIFVSEGSDSAYLKKAALASTKLAGVAFWGAPLDLTGITLTGADLDHALIPAANFASANLSNANAASASFIGSVFTGAQLSGSGTNLSSASFVNGDLTNANFSSANLVNADFSGARAENTNFGSATATSAAFTGTHVLYNPLAFQNAVLDGADFNSAILGGSPNAEGGVNFNSAHLSSAHFDQSQCVGCNFSQARLGQATFKAAYLPGANFTGAVLTGVHLDDAFTATSSGVWTFNLGLGEPPFSLNYDATNWNGADTTGVAVCPNGQNASQIDGCLSRMAQEDPSQTPVPPPCSPSGESSCMTPFSTMAGNGSAGYGPAQVNNPADVLAPKENVAYFADTGNFVVRQAVAGQSAPTLIAGTPGVRCAVPSGPCGDGGVATAASFVEPVGLALGWDGTLYVADRGGNKIRMVTPGGVISTLAGTGVACSSPTAACGDGGSPLAANLTSPSGLWADPVGNVYFADSGANRIRVVTTANTIQTIAGTGAACATPTGACGDGGPATHAQLTNPTRVVGDQLGNLYISDTGDNKIRKLAPDNTITTVFGTGVAGYNGTVDPITGLPMTGTEAQLNAPTGLATALSGALFVADTGNGLIRVLSIYNGIGLTAGLVNDFDTASIEGWNGDGLWADQTELQGPVGVAVTPRNQYVISDTGNQRVRKFGPYPADDSAAPVFRDSALP